MFGNAFNPQNGFWQWLARACDIVGLSLCWIVCSLPVVTVGAATTALYDSVYHGVRRGEPGDYARFFRTFKESFKPATLLTVPALLAAAAFCAVWYVVYVIAYNGNEMALVLLYAYRILVCVPLAVWLFAMFTLSRFTFSAGSLLVTAAKLAIGHLPTAVVVALLVEELALYSLRHLFLPVLFTPGIAALLCSLFMERIFAPYLPEAEEPKTGAEAE